MRPTAELLNWYRSGDCFIGILSGYTKKSKVVHNGMQVHTGPVVRSWIYAQYMIVETRACYYLLRNSEVNGPASIADSINEAIREINKAARGEKDAAP